MSRAGAKARREELPERTVVITRIRTARPSQISYVDLHALACGCATNNHAYPESLCLFGDGWLDAE